ncbi:MAG: hypothetical protein ACRDSR_03705, partial [Pseudonocardiaceae bacterium]
GGNFEPEVATSGTSLDSDSPSADLTDSDNVEVGVAGGLDIVGFGLAGVRTEVAGCTDLVQEVHHQLHL